jgi:hypothetical protein
MSQVSHFISSLKDSIKDFVAGEEDFVSDDEHIDANYLQDGPRLTQDGEDEGTSGFRSASEEEVLAFASYLGIDCQCHKDLLWIAREALASPLPLGWKECVGADGAVFFVQKESRLVQWEHPLDPYYKALAVKLIQEKESAATRLVTIAEATLAASAPFFAKADQNQRVVVATEQTSEALSPLQSHDTHSLATASQSAHADAEAAAAAAALVHAQAAEDEAVHHVSSLEAIAAASDARAAALHHRSLASSASYAAPSHP